MRNLWDRLESYLEKHAPRALDSLNPPASERAIRAAERELGIKFPEDFIASLRIHDGQMQETGKPPHPISFIPGEYETGGVYRATFGGLAPLSLVVSSTLLGREMIRDYLAGGCGFEYDGPIRRDGKLSWIVFVDAGSGDTLGLDLMPDKRGQFGQVLSIIHDPSCLLVLAPSYQDWFRTLVNRYESGRYIFVDEDGELDAIDTFQPQADPKSQHDSEPNNGDILRFPF